MSAVDATPDLAARYPSLRDKRVLITGGAGGIAAAAAQRFVRDGARLALIDIDRARCEKVAHEVGGAAVIAADLTQRAAVESAVAAAREQIGGADVLVTCAGGYRAYANFEDIEEADWNEVIALNLHSVFLCCKAVIPHMKSRGWGRIINLGSLAGRSTSAGTSPAHYAAAKAAVAMLTQYIAKDVAPYGITANTIAPGTTETERVGKLLTPEKRAAFTKMTPVGRMARPEDIAGVIAFLASDDSGYITGATIDVNGGRLMLV
jgi:NAD(P)-dependent dehydrogenase (short-subunit alcohol dehydrogenase family)